MPYPTKFLIEITRLWGLPEPAMAHSVGLPLRPCEPASATDHRVSESLDRSPAQTAREEAFASQR